MTQETSSIERLAKLNPEQEIWWDSSPLIYSSWVDEVLQKISSEDKKSIRKKHLACLYNETQPEKSVFYGVTTNPPLSLHVVKKQTEYWTKWVTELVNNNKTLTSKELFWKLYTEIVYRGAEMYKPVFEHSKYKRGYISGQVDPRLLTNTAEMVAQGIIMNQTNRNVMIKMPGTKEGIYGIMLLTAMGIPTNATLTFVLSQLVAVAEAVKQGLAIARANNVDLSKWRSCVTHMLGRFEDAKEFSNQAEKLGIKLSDADRRWAGIAVFKKGYQIFQERKYESKLLAASMRIGPEIDSKKKVWHLEKIAGGNIVLTVFPNIFEAYLEAYDTEKIESKIDEPVPQEVLDKLLKIPYFRDAYDEHGITPGYFIKHPAVVETATGFMQSADELEDFVKNIQKKK